MKEIFFFFFILSSICAYGQSEFASKLMVGTSITVINFDEDEIQNREFTWSTNLAVPLNQRFLFGFNFLNISTQINNTITTEQYSEKYFIVGPYVQFDLLKNYKSRLFGEAGIYTGNYCTCDEISGYKRDGLFYYNWGAGVNWHLYKGLFLDTSFNAYYIINKAFLKFAYTQPIIGLDYHFGMKKQ